MTKLTPEYLPPFITMLRAAMDEGTITIEQAKEFVGDAETVVMEAMVNAKRFGNNLPRPPVQVIERPEYPAQRMAGERRPYTGAAAERIKQRRLEREAAGEVDEEESDDD
jgi:hypothetical protein